MKNLLIASTVALVLGTAAASAEPYIALLGGPTWDPGLTVGATKQDLKTGFNIGGRVGYGLDEYGLKNWSVEADTFYNSSNFESATGARLRSLSVMGNLIYHADLGLPVGLYGGGGIGAVNTDYGSALASGSSTVLGWQAIGGIEYPVSPSMNLFAEYRYQNAHNVNVGPIQVGNTSNNLSVGMKFHL